MRKITPKQYAQSLYEALQGKTALEAEKIFDNWLRLIWQNKNWKNLNKIVASFKKYYWRAQNLIEASAVFAHQPSEPEKIKFIKWLENYTAKKIILASSVDEKLIGGVVVNFDDSILDASVLNQLNNLHQTLIK